MLVGWRDEGLGERGEGGEGSGGVGLGGEGGEGLGGEGLGECVEGFSGPATSHLEAGSWKLEHLEPGTWNTWSWNLEAGTPGTPGVPPPLPPCPPPPLPPLRPPLSHTPAVLPAAGVGTQDLPRA